MLWITCYLIPAFLYKLCEWIYYTFISKEPKPAGEANAQIPCPLANSGLPSPHKQDGKTSPNEEVISENANTSASEAEGEPCKTKDWWKARTPISSAVSTFWGFGMSMSISSWQSMTKLDRDGAQLLSDYVRVEVKQSIHKSRDRSFAE